MSHLSSVKWLNGDTNHAADTSMVMTVAIGDSDATFGKMTNQNQTDTNEIATMESKYQTDFYFAEKYQYLTKF